MKSIPARHTNITGKKVFGIEIICTYIIDFEHKIEGYGRCCCSVYHQICGSTLMLHVTSASVKS